MRKYDDEFKREAIKAASHCDRGVGRGKERLAVCLADPKERRRGWDGRRGLRRGAQRRIERSVRIVVNHDSDRSGFRSIGCFVDKRDAVSTGNESDLALYGCRKFACSAEAADHKRAADAGRVRRTCGKRQGLKISVYIISAQSGDFASVIRRHHR